MTSRTLSIALVLLGTTAGPATGLRADVIFREPFAGTALDPAWTVDVSREAVIGVKDGELEITAAENAYAHIERKLGADLVRASCAIRPGSGVSWATSLFLYWGPGDWCQMGIIPRGNGRYYVCITTGGRRGEHDLSRCRFDAFQPVAIELGEDCIRFQSSRDGQEWTTELVVPRPAELKSAPSLLILGKGYGTDQGAPDLDSDYGERGAPAVSRIRNVEVQATPAARLHVTAEEKAAQEAASRDPLGLRVLAAPADPTYERVAALLPPILTPREAVGVKDHRYEVGVAADGSLQLAHDRDNWQSDGGKAFFEVGSPAVRFGSTGCDKRLLDGHLPIVVSTFTHEGVEYEETVFGYTDGLGEEGDLWAYARLRARNRSPDPKEGEVALRLVPESISPALRTRLTTPGRGTADFCARIPSPPGSRKPERVEPAAFQARLDETAQAWTRLLEAGMQVRVPEERVNQAWRAWLAYNFIDVDKVGNVYEPRDGSGFYEFVYGYSAALYCHALDMWGYHEDSRRYLESLLTFVKPDGLFFVNYGLPDMGSLLMAMSEHYRMTDDAEWLRRVSPQMLKICDWLTRTRRESMKEQDGKRHIAHGLIFFTPYCDYQEKQYDYYGDAYSCIGMESTARALADAGLKAEAARIAKEAAAYRQDILTSMDAAVIEHEGTRLLPMEPASHRLLKSTQYEGGDYYGLVASMFLEAEFLPADDPRARLVTSALENRRGLILGMCEFDDGVDHAYSYGYWVNCLRRNEIRRVLLGFYGTLAYGMGRDTFCGVEVTYLTTGHPTPTMPHLYSGTQQLRLLRMMLLHEEGERLVIGKGIPSHWLAQGQRVEVRNAATRFGPVSFVIESAVDDGRIDVRVSGAARLGGGPIEVHLRTASGKPIRAVETQGTAKARIQGQTAVLEEAKGELTLTVRY